jgi:hypothetical protein
MFFGSAGDETQSLVHARQVLYLCYIPSLLIFQVLKPNQPKSVFPLSGCDMTKPDVILKLERGEEPWTSLAGHACLGEFLTSR